jgi:TonB family protein
MRSRRRSTRSLAALLALGAPWVATGATAAPALEARVAAVEAPTRPSEVGRGTGEAAPDVAARPEGWPVPPRASRPAPAAAFTRLPPGLRMEADRVGFALLGDTDDPAGARWVERLDDERLEIEFTVDPDLEARVRALLDARGVTLGQVVVLDPSDGRVFAYVTTDPERFPATRRYPAASLMKVVTAAAVLRHHPEAADRDCRYRGSPWALRRDDLVPPAEGGHVSSFWRALAISNNQCFARLAVDAVGRDALLDEIERVGLLEPPAPGHPAGAIEAGDDPLALGGLGSGLSGSFVTPLAAARLAALLAHGTLVRPTWVAHVRDDDGHRLAVPEARPPPRTWTPEVTERLRELLVHVTEDGTARSGFVAGDGSPRLGAIRVSGKTGTLSGHDPEGRYRWFAGVAPADAPQLAIAAVVVDGPSAARLAADVLAEAFCRDDACTPEHAAVFATRQRARDAEVEAQIEAEYAAVRAARVRALTRDDWEELRDVVDLDEAPRPIGDTTLRFPERLRRRKVDGHVVLLLELSREGAVTSARVDASDLPEFEDVVLAQVRGWRFTPPTERGRPVRARARLPIPIHVR